MKLSSRAGGVLAGECAASSKQKQSKLPPPFRQLNKFDTAKATWDTDFNCSSNFNFDSDYVSAQEKVKKRVGKGEGKGFCCKY